MPAKSLDTIKETLLYGKEKVSLPGNRDRRINNSSTLADRTDANLGGRVTEFHNLLCQKLYYRIPLKFFYRSRSGTFPTQYRHNIFIYSKSNLNKLFQSNAQAATVSASPDAKIIYHDTPYIYYQQITLDDNF